MSRASSAPSSESNWAALIPTFRPGPPSSLLTAPWKPASSIAVPSSLGVVPAGEDESRGEKVRCVVPLRLARLVKPKVASGRQGAAEFDERGIALSIIVVAATGAERDRGRGQDQRNDAGCQSAGKSVRSSP